MQEGICATRLFCIVETIRNMEQNHLELAKEAVKTGDMLTASVEATKAIAETPENYEAYVIRAQISMAFGDKKGATEDLKKAVELNPDLLRGMNGEFKNKEDGHCH